MDRKNPGGDRTDLYHLFVKTSRQEKKRGRAVLHIERYIVKYKKVYAKQKDIKTITFVKLKYKL